MLIRIVYEAPENEAEKANMLLSVKKGVYDAKGLVGIEKNTNSELRSMLFATVEVYGSGFPRLKTELVRMSDTPPFTVAE